MYVFKMTFLRSKIKIGNKVRNLNHPRLDAELYITICKSVFKTCPLEYIKTYSRL